MHSLGGVTCLEIFSRCSVTSFQFASLHVLSEGVDSVSYYVEIGSARTRASQNRLVISKGRISMTQEFYEPPELRSSDIIGASIEVDEYNLWGPFPTGRRPNDECHVQVVKKTDSYHGLPQELLMGVDHNSLVRFISDVPKKVEDMMISYKRLQDLNAEPTEEEELRGRISDCLEVIVIALCR